MSIYYNQYLTWNMELKYAATVSFLLLHYRVKLTPPQTHKSMFPTENRPAPPPPGVGEQRMSLSAAKLTQSDS